MQTTELLEREGVLAELDEALRDAQRQAGRLVFVAGEAGVGKTSLLGRFAADHDDEVRVLWGACEPFETPRPLGPVHDMAADLGGAARGLLQEGAAPEVLFPALLDDLSRGDRPTLLLVEDVHWADEATLDLLRYWGRRVGRSPGMLLLATYRNDEVGASHPLRLVLGDLATSGAGRLRLKPLSKEAVERLAGARRGLYPADELHRATGGNPFFVTEILESGGRRVPATVRDAVLTRAARLSAPARRVLDATSLVPGRVGMPLLAAAAGGDLAGLDECLAGGVLRNDDGWIAFRHEIARRVCEDTVPPHDAAAIHRRILDHLLERNADPSRIVHHAARCGDREAVLRHVPAAVREADAVGAHREAAAHYRLAIERSEGLDEAERAALLEGLSYRCYLTDQVGEALDARRRATDLYAHIGDARRHGDGLRWMSRLSWFLGRKGDADDFGRRAVEVLAPLGDGPELAMAYSNRAQLHMLAQEHDDAIEWGGLALDLAERIDDPEILSHALNNVGTARYQAGGGSEELERGLRLALEHRLQEHAARAYTNLGAAAIAARRYEEGLPWLDEGIEYTTVRDLDSWRIYMLGWRARARFERGDWAAAAADARTVAERDGTPPISCINPFVVLAGVRSRRGEEGAEELLDRAWLLAKGTGELQRLGPVAAARLEHAWLHGRDDEAAEEATNLLERACEAGDEWTAGALAWALHRAGRPPASPPPSAALAPPWRAQLEGRWRDAADEWHARGCAWEEALALLSADDETAVREALALLDGLAARPAAQIARQRLRELGVRTVPRGHYGAARTNPAHLTARQLEVLRLLARGLTNREISERLHISAKTAEHHVSAILAKLEVESRRDAAAAAGDLGLLDGTP